MHNGCVKVPAEFGIAARDLLASNKKSLLLIMIVGLVIGFVISWSIPTTYSTEVRLVPDKSTLENSNFISDVVKSKPFLLGFWTMKVSRQHEDTEILLRDYILNDMKFILIFPQK